VTGRDNRRQPDVGKGVVVRRTVRFGLLALVAAFVLVTVSVTSAADDGKKVTLTVATIRPVDTLNPAQGELVMDYEVWNLQFATLTDKAAKDFATIPGLAESWKGSSDGKTWTYTLREGLEWSDGTPLTAEHIAYTINRSRDDEWLNYTATLTNVKAEVADDRTVVLTSSVPDPKLPTMDVYIVPKHVYEKIPAKDLSRYQGLDGVGSGPFTLDEYKKGQFIRMKANPGYWGGKPEVDEVIFRQFTNSDAMVAALKKGEVDVVHEVPPAAYNDLTGDKGIVTLDGQQGGFTELAINGGAGLKKPHPALLDLRVRQAIAHALDKKTLVEKVNAGIGTPATALSPSANPEWIPEIPAAEQYDFDLAKANEILDAAGYEDADGDGIRELPGGGDALVFRYALRSESEVAKPIAEFITGWLKELGIGTKLSTYSDSQLTTVIGKGDYDLMVWGWTPFVDPDPMLSYFTCDQVSSDPKDPTNYYNDASWCDPEYDRLYKQQNVELDKAKRVQIVHDMLTRFYRSGVYDVLYYEGDQQAYRTDRFTGWIKQPAGIGPVVFSNTSPTYAVLKPIGGGAGGGGGLATGAWIAIAAAGAAVIALLAFLLMRRRSAEERE